MRWDCLDFDLLLNSNPLRADSGLESVPQALEDARPLEASADFPAPQLLAIADGELGPGCPGTLGTPLCAGRDLKPSGRRLPNCSFSNPGELASWLCRGWVLGNVPCGMEGVLKEVKRTAPSGASSNRPGLFPLPVKRPSQVSNPSDRMDDLTEDVWLPLVGHALNQLAGWKKEVPSERKGQVQTAVKAALKDRLARFSSLFTPYKMDVEAGWEDLKRKKLSYDGEEFTEPVPLSIEQIEKSLPPKDHGGSVELLPLLVGRAKYLLENPSEVVLPYELKEVGPNTAKVHIVEKDRLQVWKLLEARGVIKWINHRDVYADAGGAYLSGMFGVEKPNKVTTSGLPLLRVIMNLKPINRALDIIQGDISELPMATTWQQLLLQPDECL